MQLQAEYKRRAKAEKSTKSSTGDGPPEEKGGVSVAGEQPVIELTGAIFVSKQQCQFTTSVGF